MIIGIPREVKTHEYRVGATPDGVAGFVAGGHQVLVEVGAGLGAGFSDAQYEAAGGVMLVDRAEVWARAELIVKVKEPLPSEYGLFRSGQLLFTYLHLAAVPELADALRAAGVTAIAYETIQMPDGFLPCLQPMSAIAGRLSVQAGAKHLERPAGGRGVLLGGVPGVERAHVMILGGGVVGTHAAQMAVGLGADVTMFDVSQRRLAELDVQFGGRVQTLYATPSAIARELTRSELVIGAVLVPGASAPRLVRREHLQTMLEGSVIADVAVDQGGCFETTRPTTHDAPTYVIDGVVHYCVANMPSAVARTSTLALTATTQRYALALADSGMQGAFNAHPELKKGLNVYAGKITHAAVASSLGHSLHPVAA